MGRILVYLSTVALLAAVVMNTENVNALNVCSSTDVIGVRGSGQRYGESPELLAIAKLLPDKIKFIELENSIPELANLPSYKAIEVADKFLLNRDGWGAVITRSSFGEYRKSVDSGKVLLKEYLKGVEEADKCIVLVGFSQGAQVVNETVRDMHKTDSYSLKNVIYIGLFGDPMYNPFGFDLPHKPSWLRGDALYPFYGSLYKDIGAPGVEQPDYVPRNPLNPKAPFTKIGSWCNYGDVVCAVDTEHYAAMRDGHATYTGDSAVEMVDEIRAAVVNPDQNITNAIYPSSACGATKQDMVVLLDTSAYMRRNRDLFTKDRNGLDTKLVPGTNQRALRTFGEQLFDSGCSDKRIAVVGFEGSSGQAPRLLLDFTTKPGDIDNLMDSLYAPSTGGVAEKPQLREAAILGMRQNWRNDASRTLFAISPMAGSGAVTATWRENWMSTGVMDRYMNDTVGQQLLKLSRQTRTAIITAQHLPIDMGGFSLPTGYPGSNDAYNYFQGMARLTGGYNWEKVFHLYISRHTVKNVDFSSQILQFEKRRDGTRVAMRSVRAKVGEPVTLSLDDTANLLASAGIRGHGTATEWYLDCGALQIRTDYPVLQQNNGKITFKPTKAGSCTAVVRVTVQGSGNGCYWGCPEPFPPYMLKVIPFTIDVRPADYIEKVPGDIVSMTKTIYDDRVEFAWLSPAYDGTELVYLIKDTDGSALGATMVTRAAVTDTEKQDVEVLIQAIGADGRSNSFSSSAENVTVIDGRTQPQEIEEVAMTNPGSSSEPPSSTGVARPAAEVDLSVRQVFEGMEVAEAASGQTLGRSIDSKVSVQTPRAAHTSAVTRASSESWWWSVPLAMAMAYAGYRIRLVIRRA